MQERRKRGVESWRRWIYALSLIAWVLSLLAIILFHYARPEMETGLVAYFDLDVRRSWDEGLALWMLYALVSVCLLSFSCLATTAYYHHRKSDYFSVNTIILIVLSLFSLWLFFTAV